MPSNNFVNGMRVNVPNYMHQPPILKQTNKDPRESTNLLNSMTSQEFSSAMRSNPTINNISVNLNKPINPLAGTAKSGGLHVMSQPLQMCQSNYDNDIGVASSHYQTEESSLVSAEYAAMN